MALVLLAATALAYQDSGVRTSEFWPPLPHTHTEGSGVVVVMANTFRFIDMSGLANSSIPMAISIYKDLIFPPAKLAQHAAAMHAMPGATGLAGIEITAVDPGFTPLQPEMDESYSLTIPPFLGMPAFAQLRANTYVGVLRGLETFAQAVVFSVVSHVVV